MINIPRVANPRDNFSRDLAHVNTGNEDKYSDRINKKFVYTGGSYKKLDKNKMLMLAPHAEDDKDGWSKNLSKNLFMNKYWKQQRLRYPLYNQISLCVVCLISKIIYTLNYTRKNLQMINKRTKWPWIANKSCK